MPRFFAYQELRRGFPAPVGDILQVSGEIQRLPALRAGSAVLAGSAAWGTVSVRSDIDVMAYECSDSASLKADIQQILDTYVAANGRRHDPPQVDVTWIGAENERLVERDNLVSRSAPILEPRMVSEIFERTCVRLIDHLQALAAVKGPPWRGFVERYLASTRPDPALRRDVFRAYGTAMADQWRRRSWSLTSYPFPSEGLAQLGHVEGFANHLARLVLADVGAYPRPDRHNEVRAGLAALSQPWAEDLRHVLAPLFALADQYDALVAALTSDSRDVDERAYYATLGELAQAINMDAVEQFMWRYLAS